MSEKEYTSEELRLKAADFEKGGILEIGTPMHPSALYWGRESKIYTAREAYDAALKAGWKDHPHDLLLAPKATPTAEERRVPLPDITKKDAARLDRIDAQTRKG